MRPSFTLLDSDLVRRILAEARDLLETLGLEIHNPAVQEMLLAEGARLDPATSRVCLGAALVDRAVALAPRTFRLHDVHNLETHCLGSGTVSFTPGSAAINILDGTPARSASRTPPTTSATPRSSAACRTSPRRARPSSRPTSTRRSPTATGSF